MNLQNICLLFPIVFVFALSLLLKCWARSHSQNTEFQRLMTLDHLVLEFFLGNPVVKIVIKLST